MTFKELAVGILAMPPSEQDKPAGVWPPGECPAAAFVVITGLGMAPVDMTDFSPKESRPVMLTGKNPA